MNNFSNRQLKHLYPYNLQTVLSNCRNLRNLTNSSEEREAKMSLISSIQILGPYRVIIDSRHMESPGQDLPIS